MTNEALRKQVFQVEKEFFGNRLTAKMNIS